MPRRDDYAVQECKRAHHYTRNAVPFIKRLAYSKEAEWGTPACKWASSRLLGFKPPPDTDAPAAEVQAWVQQVRSRILGLGVPAVGDAADEDQQLQPWWADKWVGAYTARLLP
jgi:hypothetical protein